MDASERGRLLHSARQGAAPAYAAQQNIMRPLVRQFVVRLISLLGAIGLAAPSARALLASASIPEDYSLHTWGDVPFPSQRAYNQFGDLYQLTNYGAGSGWNSALWPMSTTGTGDTTTRYYDEPTGLLTKKTDSAGQAVVYQYYNNYIPLRKSWARGASFTNYYNDAGDLVQTDYVSNPVSGVIDSVVTTNYNRFGLATQITDDSGTHTLTLDYAGRQTVDQCTSGLLSGVTVTNRFNLRDISRLCSWHRGLHSLGVGLTCVQTDARLVQLDYRIIRKIL
jgi:hypothetical protein